MSSYFDEKTRLLRESISAAYSDDAFMTLAAGVEERVIHDVLALTGDREFPADLRDLALARIATLRAGPPAGLEGVWPPTAGEHRTRVTRRSALIDSLHNLWHGVAASRFRTRWGVLTDDPAADVAARDRFDAREKPGAIDRQPPEAEALIAAAAEAQELFGDDELEAHAAALHAGKRGKGR